MLKPVLNSVCLLMLAGANLFAADPILRAGSTWKYWDKGSEPPAEGSISWKQAGYSEAGWLTGAAQLGYGDGDESTLISFGPNASAKYITAYFRKTFTVGDLSSYSNISLNITRDDGAVIYLNGTEIGRFNMSGGQSSYSTYAVTAIEETVDRITLPPSVLNSGENLLAVEIHQANATSSDLSFDLELVGEGLVTRGPYPPANGHIYQYCRSLAHRVPDQQPRSFRNLS